MTAITFADDGHHIAALGLAGRIFLCSFETVKRGFCMSCMSCPSCASCHSENVREYPAEINIHFPGMNGLTIPTVWVFPKLLVCLDCGAAQFSIPDTERETLADSGARGWPNEDAV